MGSSAIAAQSYLVGRVACEGEVSSMSELPVPSTQRYPTDKLCLYLYLALLLPTLLFSLLRLPPHALDLILHPYDSFGRPCGGSLLPSHPFLFYPSLHNSVPLQ